MVNQVFLTSIFFTNKCVTTTVPLGTFIYELDFFYHGFLKMWIDGVNNFYIILWLSEIIKK